jgi:hypothetical protein
VNPDPTQEKEFDRLERRVEALAGEIAALINTSRGNQRNDLKDLALSIVREEVRTGEEDREAFEPGGRPTAPFNPIAIAIPFFLIAAVMIVLFPPMGLFLFAVSFLLLGWGVVVSLFARR